MGFVFSFFFVQHCFNLQCYLHMLFLQAYIRFCECLSSRNLGRLLHFGYAAALWDQNKKEPDPCEMCGNEDLFKQSIFEWFPRFFHNHHWVVQGKEIEVFSVWKLISRQEQERAPRKKEKSRQCKCPAGT